MEPKLKGYDFCQYMTCCFSIQYFKVMFYDLGDELIEMNCMYVCKTGVGTQNLRTLTRTVLYVTWPIIRPNLPMGTASTGT